MVVEDEQMLLLVHELVVTFEVTLVLVSDSFDHLYQLVLLEATVQSLCHTRHHSSQSLVNLVDIISSSYR